MKNLAGNNALAQLIRRHIADDQNVLTGSVEVYQINFGRRTPTNQDEYEVLARVGGLTRTFLFDDCFNKICR
jgi:hypothetical protein